MVIIMAEEKNTIKSVMDIFKNDWNKQVILYGPPGTSKTYSSTIIAGRLLGAGDNADYDACKNHLDKVEVKDRFKLVQFHPSYCYEDFVRGIKVKTENGKPNYNVEAQIFEKFCDEAKNALGNNKGKYTYDKDNAYVIVIDEINRAPLASVLGELIYALEYRGQRVLSSYEIEGKDGLVVPPNVYIIGTMNTADRSIGSIDYAVRRRFAFIPVGSNGDMIKDSWGNDAVGNTAKELYDAITDKEKGLFKKDLLADPDMDAEDIKIGHTYFLGNKNDKDTIDYLKYRVQYQIVPIYLEYIKDGIIKKEGKVRLKEILKEILKDKDKFGDTFEDIAKKYRLINN